MRKAGQEGPARGHLLKQHTDEDSLYRPAPQVFTRHDEADLVAIWWRLRRWHDVPLSAQRNVIVHDGGADPNRPRPRTQSPQPEAGGPDFRHQT